MTDMTMTVPPEMVEALGTVERIGGLELIEKLTGLFEKSSRERMAAFGALIAAGDRKQVSRTAHAVKGSAAQVGAEGLRALAAALEKEAIDLEPPALLDRVDALSREADRAIAQLHAFIREQQGGA